MDNLKNYFLAAAFAGVAYLGSTQISLGQSLVNGDFTSFSNTAPTVGEGITSVAYSNNQAPAYTGATLTGWSNAGYAFVYVSPNVGDEVVTGSGGNFSLWGQSNGGTGTLVLPPGGGNFIAEDGAYQTGPLTQVITGLTSGQQYAVSFEWAGAQQKNYTGATTESWSVALGAATGIYTPTGFQNGANYTTGTLAGSQTTSVANNSSHGFTGWMSQTFTFTADNTSDTLYFFANGTPVGQPPFALLADVTMTAVPEPATTASLTILFGMLILLGNRVWRLRQKSPTPNS